MRLARARRFRQRVQAPVLLDVGRRLGEVPIDHEGAHQQPVAVGARRYDVIAGRDFALVARRQEQVLAALAAVGTGEADVGDPEEAGVVDRPEDAGRDLHDRRPVLDVDLGDAVDGRGVGRQQEGPRIEELLGDAHAEGAHPGLLHALEEGVDRGRRAAGQEGLDSPREVELVVDLAHRLVRGHPIEELQPPEPGGLDHVWGLDRLGDPRRVFRLLLSGHCDTSYSPQAVYLGNLGFHCAETKDEDRLLQRIPEASLASLRDAQRTSHLTRSTSGSDQLRSK